MFVDRMNITVRSGRGGYGSVSFRREKFLPKGGPNGGNGGKGASIYVYGDYNVKHLFDFRHQREFIGKNGAPGLSFDRAGKNAEDLFIKVPIGTEIYEDNQLIADIMDNKPVLLAKGGGGGIGNGSLASSTNRLPRYAIPPKEGVERKITLVLKLIADIGLVGAPNAGKSSLINKLCKTTYRVADFAFTTLNPQLGVYKSKTLVDLPGIIEDASSGKGLGIQFLQHISRCKTIFIVLDVSNKPLETFNYLRKELDNFGIYKPYKIILNKIELVKNKTIKSISKQLPKKPILISIHKSIGINKLL